MFPEPFASPQHRYDRAKVVAVLLGVALVAVGCGRSPQQLAGDQLRQAGCDVRSRPVGQGLDVFWVEAPAGRLSPDFFETLGKLPSVETLIIAKTEFADGDIARLPVLTRLKTLDFSDNSLTDAAGPALIRLGNIETLILDGNALTDAAIPDLGQLRGLRAISMQRTKITSAGLEQLQKALPLCLVTN